MKKLFARTQKASVTNRRNYGLTTLMAMNYHYRHPRREREYVQRLRAPSAVGSYAPFTINAVNTRNTCAIRVLFRTDSWTIEIFCIGFC